LIARCISPGTLLLGGLLLFMSLTTCAAGKDTIAVIYPDIGEPYREIFTKIIVGIEDKAGTGLAKYPVRSDTDITMLKASLLRQHTKVVIALGRQGMKTATALGNDIRVVVGGVLTVPENETQGQLVINLSPDPALLFARMKALMPATKRVFVVYDPRISGWLITLAKEAARTQGLELVEHEAHDLRSAVRFYQEIFSAADSHSDVLWLPQDSTTVEESSVLPLVLQESWSQDIAVFSSNFVHVRRGVLFSLYPDNVALGKSLAGLAQGMLVSGNDGTHGMLPLRDVQSAVNLRTAQHLGITSARYQDFDLIFPEQ
jgi:putative ABC transport system substrate-binding protein